MTDPMNGTGVPKHLKSFILCSEKPNISAHFTFHDFGTVKFLKRMSWGLARVGATLEETMLKRATEYVIDTGMRNHTMIRASARSSDHANRVLRSLGPVRMYILLVDQPVK